MRHKKKKIFCSKDYKEDMPLTKIKRKDNCNVDSNSYDSLCVPSSQSCEFCEKVSKSRYSNLIHTARHIIIPLFKLTVYQCEICLHHFTSTNDLSRHQAKVHLLYELVTQKSLNEANSNNHQDKSYELDLITIVKQETSDKTQSEDARNSGTHQNCNSIGGSLKSRLLFEEDIISVDCERLMNDLTTDCRVNVELFPPIWDVDYPQSIHYDLLVRPGVFRCKKCREIFPNRYEMIVHESKHIYIKNSQVIFCNLCNNYILGDYKQLKHHKLKSHTLIYSQKYKDTKLHNGGNTAIQNGGIERLTKKVSTLKLCDVCFSFCKKRESCVYQYLGELCKIGRRYRCDKCGLIFFCINLVKRETKYKYSSFAGRKNKNKVLSNEEKLKLISHRFKMMRNYILVLFIVTLYV